MLLNGAVPGNCPVQSGNCSSSLVVGLIRGKIAVAPRGDAINAASNLPRWASGFSERSRGSVNSNEESARFAVADERCNHASVTSSCADSILLGVTSPQAGNAVKGPWKGSIGRNS